MLVMAMQGQTGEQLRAWLHDQAEAIAYRTKPVPPPRPIPRPRGPLPRLDSDTTDPDTGAPLPVHKTINGAIPPFDDQSYMRANLWGVTIPGLPPIPGGAGGAAQERMLSYLFERYPRAVQDLGLRTYAERGYRHFWRSWPDARSNSGQSLQQYVDDTKRVQDAGLIPCHFLRSKDYDGRNPDPTLVDQAVDALLAIDGIPWACHAWEASLFYDPARLRATIEHDATRAPSVRWCVHLQEGYADFGPDGHGHGPAFWKANIAVGVKTLLYQYKVAPAWSAGMMQARGNDVSVRLVQGGLWGLPETVDWIGFEVIAQLQFNNQVDGDGRLATEDIGDLKGYEILCTPGPLPPRGFGNGARMPDGRVI